MAMTEPIVKLRDEHAFLSNMHMLPCEFEGDRYPTVEHAFQAAKFPKAGRLDFLAHGLDPKSAKRLGREKRLPPSALRAWEAKKLEVLESCVRSKFSEGEARRLLLGTDGREIIEGNHWHDNYYGVCMPEAFGKPACIQCSGFGQNHLGKTLMRVRDELRHASASAAASDSAATSKPTASATASPELSAEQRKRMERSRQLALQRRVAAASSGASFPPAAAEATATGVAAAPAAPHLLVPPLNLVERGGNLLEASESWIVHQTNCVTDKVGGGGLSEQVFKRFPHANIYFLEHAQGRRSKPGEASFCGGIPGGQRGVINLHGQVYPGPPKHGNDSRAARAAWFAQALARMAQHPAFALRKESIAFPHEIGCGIAGGEWPVYRSAIEDFARRLPAVRVAVLRFGSGVKRGR